MNLLEAVIMGIVQGLAEFLPISSSGHLAIFKYVLNIDLEASGGILFDVMLHFGTLIAIFVAFWKEIKTLFLEGIFLVRDIFINLVLWIRNLFQKEKVSYRKIQANSYRKFVILILVSTVPTGLIGIFFNEWVEKASSTIIVPGICLWITAVVLFLAEHCKPGNKHFEQITYKDAIIVGSAQGIATIPGLSRSGTTIMTCLKLGFDKEAAVKYSFIMSIPAVLGAVVLQIKDFEGILVNPQLITNYSIGTIVAAVVGYICIKTMLVIVQEKKYRGFIYYCLTIGTIAVLWNFIS